MVTRMRLNAPSPCTSTVLLRFCAHETQQPNIQNTLPEFNLIFVFFPENTF